MTTVATFVWKILPVGSRSAVTLTSYQSGIGETRKQCHPVSSKPCDHVYSPILLHRTTDPLESCTLQSWHVWRRRFEWERKIRSVWVGGRASYRHGHDRCCLRFTQWRKRMQWAAVPPTLSAQLSLETLSAGVYINKTGLNIRIFHINIYF